MPDEMYALRIKRGIDWDMAMWVEQDCGEKFTFPATHSDLFLKSAEGPYAPEFKGDGEIDRPDGISVHIERWMRDDMLESVVIMSSAVRVGGAEEQVCREVLHYGHPWEDQGNLAWRRKGIERFYKLLQEHPNRESLIVGAAEMGQLNEGTG